MNVKRFNLNYFTKNMVLFITKEFISVVGLLTNILSFMNYLSKFNKFNDEDQKLYKSIMRYLLHILENNRKAYDCYLNQLY